MKTACQQNAKRVRFATLVGIDFYSARRPRSSLDKQIPDEFYFVTLPRLSGQHER